MRWLLLVLVAVGLASVLGTLGCAASSEPVDGGDESSESITTSPTPFEEMEYAALSWSLDPPPERDLANVLAQIASEEPSPDVKRELLNTASDYDPGRRFSAVFGDQLPTEIFSIGPTQEELSVRLCDECPKSIIVPAGGRVSAEPSAIEGASIYIAPCRFVWVWIDDSAVLFSPRGCVTTEYDACPVQSPIGSDTNGDGQSNECDAIPTSCSMDAPLLRRLPGVGEDSCQPVDDGCPLSRPIRAERDGQPDCLPFQWQCPYTYAPFIDVPGTGTNCDEMPPPQP